MVTPRTTSIIARSNFARKLSARVRLYFEIMARLPGWKIDMQSHAGFQFHGTLPHVVTGHPGFQHIIAGRKMFQPVSAGGISFFKVGRLEDENRAADSLVNLAVNRHGA